MLATKYLSDVQQLNNCQVTEAIQSLPPELREIIFKLYIAIKLRERKVLGWDEVIEAIQNAPLCEKRERIVKVVFCSKCHIDACENNGVCYVCKKNGVHHKFAYSVFDDDYDKIFRKYW